jgi:hypothetical protein
VPVDGLAWGRTQLLPSGAEREVCSRYQNGGQRAWADVGPTLHSGHTRTTFPGAPGIPGGPRNPMGPCRGRKGIWGFLTGIETQREATERGRRLSALLRLLSIRPHEV